MARLAITEALAEIKTIQKRIEVKRQFVAQYSVRQDALRDPLQNQGGSVAVLAAERQAMGDLESRIVVIRAAIYRANTETEVVVNSVSRSIADWLVWRREVVPGAQKFLVGLRSGLNETRKQAQQKGLQMRGAEIPATSGNDVIVNLDERALASEIESLEAVLGTLDGQLSLKNATTFVEV